MSMVFILSDSVFAENWPGWRGPRGDGTSNEKLAESLSRKLKMFTPSDAERVLPTIKRNLRLLIK